MRNNSYLCTVTAASTPANRDNVLRQERPIWLTYIQIRMKERIIRLSDLMAYHKVKEVYKNRIACFRMDNRLVNIDTISPAYADIFSFIAVKSGTAVFSINYRECTVGRGDMLLLSPSTLVAITGQSSDFEAMDLMCERSLFEHMISTFEPYQSYTLFFCRTTRPFLHLNESQTEHVTASMQQISEAIMQPYVYQESIINHLMHALLLQMLELVEERVNALPPALNHNETLFHSFIMLLIQHYREEHYIEFYARQLSISPTYLSRVIRKVTQKTAGYFITGMLYAEACRMLVGTDLPIQAIADKLHFSDQSAFGKFFKSNAGMSPQKYRTERQGETPTTE